MNNKKITAADLDPEFLVQLINKHGDLSTAEKALANACVGRDERIGEHQLPVSYTNMVNKKIADLQAKLNKARMLTNKIDRVDLSANITNKLDNMEKQIAALQARNATIVYQYSADAGQNKMQSVFDNLNKQIMALTSKAAQNENRSTRNESLLNQNSISVQNVTKSQEDLKKRIDDTAAKLETVTTKQQAMAIQQDEDVLTIQSYSGKVNDLEARVTVAEKTVEAMGQRIETSSQEALNTRINEQAEAINDLKSRQELNVAAIDDVKLDIGANKKDISDIREELEKNEERFNSAISTIGSLTESTKESESSIRKDITTIQKSLDGEIELRDSVTSDLTKKLNQAVDEISANSGHIQDLLVEKERSDKEFSDLKTRYDALEINASSDLATLKKRADNSATLHNQLEEDVNARFDSLNTAVNEIHEATSMPKLRTTVINEQNLIEKKDLSPEILSDIEALSNSISAAGSQIDAATTFSQTKAQQNVCINEQGKISPRNPVVQCYTCYYDSEVEALKKEHHSPIVNRSSSQVLIYDTKDDPETEEGKALIAAGEEVTGDGYHVDDTFFKLAENLNTFYYDQLTGAVYFVDDEQVFITINPGYKSYQLSVAPKSTDKLTVQGLTDMSRIDLTVQTSFSFAEEGKTNVYTVREKPQDTILRTAMGQLFITNNSDQAQTYYIIIS